MKVSGSNNQNSIWMMFAQFAKIVWWGCLAVVGLMTLPVIAVCVIVWFVTMNAVFAFRRAKLPRQVTDIPVLFVLRKRTTAFWLYVGWFIQNLIFRGFVKELKREGASYATAKQLLLRTKKLGAELEKCKDVRDSVGNEFEDVSYEKFERRDKKFLYSQHGAVMIPAIAQVGEFALCLTESDERVLRAVAAYMIAMIHKIPFLSRWRWLDDNMKKWISNARNWDVRFDLREKATKGFKVYADNMMRTANRLGALDVMREWLDAESLFNKALAVAPAEEYESEIRNRWRMFIEKANDAGRHTFEAMVRVDGFKLKQNDYIDVGVVDLVDNLTNACSDFSIDTVLVEGCTDEQYFKSAIDAFDLKLPFQYKWVGHTTASGKDENSGTGALQNAIKFLRGKNLGVRIVAQYDCDAKNREKESGRVTVRSVAQYSNSKGITRGVENALVLDAISKDKLDGFYSKKTTGGDYGKPGVSYELQKTDLCNYICSLDKEQRKIIFVNLKKEIDIVAQLFSKQDDGGVK